MTSHSKDRMSPVTHTPSYYLTEEAAAQRMAKLVQRIATEGLRPGECVPASILAEAIRQLTQAETAEINHRRAA